MRMKRLLLPLVALAFAACHSGRPGSPDGSSGAVPVDTAGYARLTFSVAAFDTLDLDCLGSLRFVQDGAGGARVEVAVHPDYARRVVASVADSVLAIRLAPGPDGEGTEGIGMQHYLFASVHAPAPSCFRLGGAGETDLGILRSGGCLSIGADGNRQIAAQLLESRCLHLSLDGASRADLPAVAADSLSVRVAGTGDAEIGGMARAAALSAVGMGHVGATRLGVAGRVEQDTAGHGRIDVMP